MLDYNKILTDIAREVGGMEMELLTSSEQRIAKILLEIGFLVEDDESILLYPLDPDFDKFVKTKRD